MYLMIEQRKYQDNQHRGADNHKQAWIGPRNVQLYQGATQKNQEKSRQYHVANKAGHIVNRYHTGRLGAIVTLLTKIGIIYADTANTGRQEPVGKGAADLY